MGTFKHYKIFADYHQFYLWDQGEFPTPPIDYTDLDLDRRIKAAPYVVVIQPERNMEVKVTLEIADAPAEISLDEWDHVAEASLSLPSGKLQIHECTGGSIDVVSVAPGTYRVRAYCGGFDTLSEDRLDGDDHYHVVLWAAPADDVRVLKQYPDSRRA